MTHLVALNNAKKALKEHLFSKFKGDVVGVGIGNKTVGITDTGELALIVYVRQKRNDLPDNERIDRDKNVHTVIEREKVLLDIKQIGHIKKLSLHRQRHRPSCGGISEGHYLITAGTAGPLVEDENGLYRVSNNHVYANENNAKIGDPIYQPGPYDGGTATDRIGGLTDFVAIRTDRANKVDAALRAASHLELLTFCGMGDSPKRVSPAELHSLVTKSGRTTEVTRGVITDLSLDLEVEYDVGLVRFDNQILVESHEIFSQGGDSGSAVLATMTSDWVGLLFAGSEDGLYTICNHATDVCTQLDVTLYTGEVEEPPVEEPPVEQPPVIEPPAEEPKESNTGMWLLIGVAVAVAVGIFVMLLL